LSQRLASQNLQQRRDWNHSIWFRSHLLVVMLDNDDIFTFDGESGIHLEDADVQKLIRKGHVTLEGKTLRLTRQGRATAKVYWSDYHPEVEDKYDVS